MPFAQRRVAQTVCAVPPVWAVNCVIEGDQHLSVGPDWHRRRRSRGRIGPPAEGQVAQVGTAQLVLQAAWHTSAQLVPAEVQRFQVGEVAQLRGYLSGQLIKGEKQHCQVGEVAQLRRYLPAQLVPTEVQICQAGEVAQLRRYLPAQLVVRRVPAYSRLTRLPNSGGIFPVNWLSLRFQTGLHGPCCQRRHGAIRSTARRSASLCCSSSLGRQRRDRG